MLKQIWNYMHKKSKREDFKLLLEKIENFLNQFLNKIFLKKITYICILDD